MDTFNSLFGQFAEKLIQVLPISPFSPFLDEMETKLVPYLGWLNWVFPINVFLEIGSAWLTAIAVFYLYSAVARWVKIIGD